METVVAENEEKMKKACGLSTMTPVESAGKVSKTAKYFRKNPNGKFECLICPPGTLIVKDKGSCTNSRWRHLRKNHPREHALIATPMSKQRTLGSMFGKEVKTRPQYQEITEQRIREECARLVIETDSPFAIVDSKALRRFASFFAQKDIYLPSSRITREDAIRILDKSKENFQKVLQSVQRVALTVDGWTTVNGANLLGATIHWIDDEWSLCNRMLNLDEIDGPHSGEYMAELLLKTLKEFGIMEKIIVVTTDNVANNGTMIRHLGLLLQREGVKTFNPKHHIPCVTHVFNLAVQDGFKNLGIESAPSQNEIFSEITEDTRDVLAGGGNQVQVTTPIGKLLRRLRRMIMAIQMSPVNMRRYEVLCEINQLPDCKKLSLDCKTQWNSTLDMINRAISKRIVLDTIAKDVLNTAKDDYNNTNEEWGLLDEFAQMLVPFAEATEMTSTSKAISISTVMSIVTGISKLLETDMTSAKDRCMRGDPSLTPEIYRSLELAYMAMILKLTKYNQAMKLNPVYVIAMCLDPSQKLTSIEQAEHQAVREKLLSLLIAEDEISQLTSTQPQVGEGTPCESSVSSCLLGKRPRRLSSFIPGGGVRSKQTMRTPMDEMNDYLDEACIDDVEALVWWKQVGQFRFPTIAKLAKNYLCICATSAPSESFSCVGQDIATYKREKAFA